MKVNLMGSINNKQSMVWQAIFVTLCVLLPLKVAIASDSIKVYAAASMTNVISELVEQYSKETGEEIVTIFAGSSSLARQIDNGAPADLFISANTKWMDYLQTKARIREESITIVAENELVLIKPKSSAMAKFDLTDNALWKQVLLNERIALGQPDSVPAGIYAKQSLTKLAVWDTVKKKIASTNSVRVALALVERGEAGLGIVYKTDALMNDKVSILDTFPEEWHDRIEYPLAIINDSERTRFFAEYLVSDDAKQVFKHYGFK